jgi:hypothetical protein
LRDGYEDEKGILHRGREGLILIIYPTKIEEKTIVFRLISLEKAKPLAADCRQVSSGEGSRVSS